MHHCQVTLTTTGIALHDCFAFSGRVVGIETPEAKMVFHDDGFPLSWSLGNEDSTLLHRMVCLMDRATFPGLGSRCGFHVSCLHVDGLFVGVRQLTFQGHHQTGVVANFGLKLYKFAKHPERWKAHLMKVLVPSPFHEPLLLQAMWQLLHQRT